MCNVTIVKIKADLLNSGRGSTYCRFKPFPPQVQPPPELTQSMAAPFRLLGGPQEPHTCHRLSWPAVAEFLAPRPHVNQVARPDRLLNCARIVDLLLKELLWPQGSEQLLSPLSTGQGAKKKMIPSGCAVTLNPRTAGCTVACRGQGHPQPWMQAAAPLSYWHFITNNRLWWN